MLKISSSFLFFSFGVLRALLQTTVPPIALPVFRYKHCYTDAEDYEFRVVLSTNSPYSPPYLRSKTTFVLSPSDSTAQKITLSTERNLIRENTPCESNLKFSTRNVEFSLLDLSIQFLLDFEKTNFAEFNYHIKSDFKQGSLTLYDKNLLVSLQSEITTSLNDEHVKMPSVDIANGDLPVYLLTTQFFEGICVVTETNTAVVLKTQSGPLRQNDGFVKEIKVTYTKNNHLKEKILPAFSCDSSNEETVLSVIEEGADTNGVQFSAIFQPFVLPTLNPRPVTVLNTDKVTIDRLDHAQPYPKLLLVRGRYNTVFCNEETEIKTFLSDSGTTLHAYRSRHAEIYKGVTSVFWDVLSPPYSCPP